MAKRKLGRGLDILIGSKGTDKGGTEAEDRERPRNGSARPEGQKERPAGAPSGGPSEPAPGKGAPSGQEGPGSVGPETAPEIFDLPPGEIELNPKQPRREFSPGELESLKRSIEREGVLQPVLVRRVPQGGYQLIAGERRLRAARELGLERVPVRLVDIPAERLLELALIENIHRADLDPVELAEAYRDLMEGHDWTQEKLAEELGVSRSGVANTLRVLELPADMQNALARGRITPGHAKVLLSASDEEDRRLLFERIAEENLSVRELEDIRDAETSKPEKAPKSRRKPKKGGRKKPYLVSLEEELSEQLGTKVRITERKSGRGVLSIEFYSQDDFERLRRMLSA